MENIAQQSGFYSQLGSLTSPYPNQASMYPDIPVPTTTDGGREVWEVAKKLAYNYPDMFAAQIVRRAMDITGVAAYECTQEDMRSIEMGLEVIISQRKNPQPPPPNPQGYGTNPNPGDLSSQGGFLR